MLCPGCGNEVEAGSECPVCAQARERRKGNVENLETSLCPGCGNTIYGVGPCSVCNSDRAPRRRTAQRRTLCTVCGNEMEAGHECSICASGRGSKRKRRGPAGAELCPGCNEQLETQDWDGVEVRMCPGCQSMLFAPNALERVLDKLRNTADHVEFSEVVKEFRDRHKVQRVPKSIRYKTCPVCEEMMVRRNYAGASGIILDVCGDHGHWVDQNAFGELSEWISRGGDQLTARRSRR